MWSCPPDESTLWTTSGTDSGHTRVKKVEKAAEGFG